jgi:predicted nucleic acid-binding protein
MRQYIVDACIVVKWVLAGEPYEEKSIQLKKDYLSGIVNLSAPSFIVQEVANSLWKATSQRRILKEDAQEALKILQDMRIDLHEFNWIEISQALNVACKLNLAIYDSSYLLLSEKLKTEIITADEQLIQKARDYFQVLHIKDYLLKS